jgi:hypothetical protein
MRFRLTYDGPLYGGANDSRARHKQEIRKRFHPQLRQWWDISGIDYLQEPHPTTRLPIKRREALAARFTCGKYALVPLVTADFPLSCSLDILFLRPDPPGQLIKSGDIDNRIKVLFDALRMPTDEKELGGLEPGDGEHPFYCLLQNDNLVANLALQTDTLLEPIGGAAGPPSVTDVRLVITVDIRPIGGALGGLSFI